MPRLARGLADARRKAGRGFEDFEVPGELRPPTVVLPHEAPPVAPEATAEGGVVAQLPDRPGQRGRIAGRDDDSGLPRRQEIRAIALARRQDGASRREVVEEAVRQRAVGVEAGDL